MDVLVRACKVIVNAVFPPMNSEISFWPALVSRLIFAGRVETAQRPDLWVCTFAIVPYFGVASRRNALTAFARDAERSR